VDYAEFYGDRRATRWTPEADQSRAKDEVLGALVVGRRAQKANKQLHEYVSSFHEKVVLLLGSYDSAGEARLRQFASCLEGLGYDPVLIKDIPDFEHYDLSQKLVVVGAMSRFIVIDDSSASGHLTEFELCRSNRWVTLVLRAQGLAPSWMTAGVSVASNVIFEGAHEKTECALSLENGKLTPRSSGAPVSCAPESPRRCAPRYTLSAVH
jgi:hypothetical protein